MILGFDNYHGCKIYLPSTKKNVDQIGENMSEIEITKFSIPSFLMMLYVFPQTNQELLIFLKGIKPNGFMFIWTILKQSRKICYEV